VKKQLTTFALSALAIAVLSGCSTTGTQQSGDVTSSAQYRALEQELASLKNSSGSDSARATQLESELARLNSSNSSSSLLPPNPKAGECYARVVIPATYKNESETVVVKAEGQRIETTSPEYGFVQERVLVSEASERLEIIPATYKNVTETIQVAEAAEQLIRVPAKYKTETERVLVRPAHTEWKKGTGPIQKVNDSTGEIMCLVEVPAEYKTVTKTILVEPESVKKIVVPGKTQMVTRRVVDKPATTRTVTIPATYKTVKVRKLMKPATQRAIEIPAEYSTVSKRVKVTDSYMEWRSILCETNTQPGLVRKLQKALKAKGYNPGAIDGVLGADTMSAVNAYQKANKMASGQLTINTIKSLGVAL